MWCRFYMMSYVCQVWWFTHLWCHGYSDTLIEMSVPSVWWHRHSGCDVKYGGWDDRYSFLLPWKQYGYSIRIGYDVINILGAMLYIEGSNVINSCCDSMHTEYDVTCIVCVMSYREWLCYKWYTGFDDTDTVDVVLDIVGQMADIMIVLPCVWCFI